MTQRIRIAAALCAALVLGACADPIEPARNALAEVEAAVAAAGADATKYTPGSVKEVNAKLAELKAALDQRDYAAVIAGAPALVAQAQALVAESAAKKQEYFDAINRQWGELAAALPQHVAAIEARIASYEQARSLPGDLTKAAVADAKVKLEETQALWGQATGAFAEGKLEEAIGLGLAVQAQAAELMARLGLPQAEETAAR